jgi:predicted ester cyclase
MGITHLIAGWSDHITLPTLSKPMERNMPSKLLATTALAAMLLTGTPASAETTEDARASIALFYEALNAASGKDVASLVRQATVAEWLSCGANDFCRKRDDVIAAIASRHKAIPDLKWEIKEVLVSEKRVIVRGEASGHPAGNFMGVPHGGRSFKVMSIDVHTVEGGKLVRSYHVEDWMSAIRQLSAQ